MTSSTSPVLRRATCLEGQEWWTLVVLILVVGLGTAEPLRAQVGAEPSRDSLSLVERYQQARVQLLARQVLMGRQSLRILSPVDLPVHEPPLLASPSPPDTAMISESPPPFPLNDVRRVRDLERSWFRDRFGDVEWSFFGEGRRMNVFDTTRTRELRARLQAQFGDPTRTFADVYSNEWNRAPDSTREEPVQFAYWFVVNGSLPVRVTDADGWQGRGLIVSTRRSHRDRLPGLREALLRPLREEEQAPYVDYVYVEETDHFFRAGFDGRNFFRERISRFDIVPERRPRLDSVRTAPSAEPMSEPAPSSP